MTARNEGALATDADSMPSCAQGRPVGKRKASRADISVCERYEHCLTEIICRQTSSPESYSRLSYPPQYHRIIIHRTAHFFIIKRILQAHGYHATHLVQQWRPNYHSCANTNHYAGKLQDYYLFLLNCPRSTSRATYWIGTMNASWMGPP